MDGGRDGANPSPPLRMGSPGQCRDSRAGETHLVALVSSELQEIPPEGGEPLRVGEDALAMGCWPGCFVSTNYVLPLFQGATQDHENFRMRVPRTNVPGNEGQEKGNCVPTPPSGGRDETILWGNGVRGEEAGESPRELFVHWTMGTPKWGTGMDQWPP